MKNSDHALSNSRRFGGELLLRARTAAGWNGASSLFGRLLTFLTVLVMARLLGPGPFGDFAIAVAVAAVIGQFVETGSALALIHHPRLSDELVWAHTVIQLVGGILRVALTLLAWQLMAIVFPPQIREMVLALTLIQLIGALGVTPRALLERDFQFRSIAIIDGLAVACSSVAGIAAAVAGMGAWAVVIGGAEPALALTLVQTSLALLVRRKTLTPRGWPVAELAWFMTFARGIWLGAQVIPITLHWDRLVVGALLGPSAVGVYDLATRLMMVPVGLVQTLVARIMVPVISRVQEDGVLIGRVLRTQSRWVSGFFSLWFAVIALAGVTGALAAGLGQEWSDAPRLALALALVGWLRAILFTVWPALIATGRTAAVAWYNLVLALGMIGAIPALAALAGTTGVAVALTASTLVAVAVLIRGLPASWIGDEPHPYWKSASPILGLGVGVCGYFVLPTQLQWACIVAALATTLWQLTLEPAVHRQIRLARERWRWNP